MGKRWQRLLAEVGKFLAVGGVATLVALLVFNLLVHGLWFFDQPPLSDHAIWALVIANTVGMVVSYRGNRFWAFRNRQPVHADGGRTAYVVINIVTMAIPVACLWLSRHVLGLDDPFSDNLAANVVGLGLGTAARFWLYRTWVFRHPSAIIPEQAALIDPRARATPDRVRPATPAAEEG